MGFPETVCGSCEEGSCGTQGTLGGWRGCWDGGGWASGETVEDGFGALEGEALGVRCIGGKRQVLGLVYTY